MPLTPLDIRKKEFSTQLRGISPREVKSFLEVIARELEDLRRERGLLAEQVDALNARLETYERTENLLKETLVTAQKTSGEMQSAATEKSKALLERTEQDARDRIREAREQADQLLDGARQQAREIEAQLRDLATRQSALLDQIRGIGHSCLSLAERWTSTPSQDRDDTTPAD